MEQPRNKGISDGRITPQKLLNFPILNLEIKENNSKTKPPAYKGYSIQKGIEQRKNRTKENIKSSHSNDQPRIKAQDIQLKPSLAKITVQILEQQSSKNQDRKNFLKPPISKIGNNVKRQPTSSQMSNKGQGQSMLIREKNREMQNLSNKNMKERQFQKIEFSQSFEYVFNDKRNDKGRQTKQLQTNLNSVKNQNHKEIVQLQVSINQISYPTPPQQKSDQIQSNSNNQRIHRRYNNQPQNQQSERSIKQNFIQNETKSIEELISVHTDTPNSLIEDLVTYQKQTKQNSQNQSKERNNNINQNNTKIKNYDNIFCDKNQLEKQVSYDLAQDKEKLSFNQKQQNEKQKFPPIKLMQQDKSNEEQLFQTLDQIIQQQSPYTKMMQEIDKEGLSGWNTNQKEELFTPIKKSWQLSFNVYNFQKHCFIISLKVLNK